MSKRTFSLIFTLFTVAFMLVVIALYNPSSYDTILAPAPTNTPEPLAQTTLRFGVLESFPVFASSSKQIAYSIPITIATKKNKVTAVQLEMSYDPQVITSTFLNPGTFFPKPVILLNKIDESNGRISYAIGASPNTSGIEGEGIVATLTFQAKSQLRQVSQISFLPKTLVMGEGSNQSVLKEAVPTQIVLEENIDN